MVSLHSVLFLCMILVSCFVGIRPRDFVWKKRILVIQSSVDQANWFSESLTNDLAERKLLVFVFGKERLEKSNFKEDIEEEDFLKLLPKRDLSSDSWVLVGLDGGVKNSGYSNPNPGEIFRIIDAMPMRQSEHFKKGNQDNSSNK